MVYETLEEKSFAVHYSGKIDHATIQQYQDIPGVSVYPINSSNFVIIKLDENAATIESLVQGILDLEKLETIKKVELLGGTTLIE